MENNNKDSKMKKVLNSRSLKYGSSSVIMIAAVIAIAVIVNMLFTPAVLSKLIGREAIKFDLTPNKVYTIGEQTDEIMKDVKKDITIYALYDESKAKDDSTLNEVNEFLKKYTKYSQIKIKYVDTDKDPTFIKKKDPDGLKGIGKNSIVIESNGKVKNLTTTDFFTTEFNQQTYQQTITGFSGEQAVAGAIKYVTSDVTPTVYFLEGHEEQKVDTNFANVSKILVGNNYDVKNLNLITEPKVPSDAEIIFIASPKKDISVQEKQKLQDFFKTGGKAFFAFDPIDGNPKFTNFESLLSEFNVSINYDRVKETDEKRSIKNRPYDILPNVVDNNINAPLNPKELYMILPTTRSVNMLKNTKEYITVTPLVKSSDKAVGEPMDPTTGKNTQGPLDIAIAVENKGGSEVSRIIVMGNSSFISDKAITQYEQFSMGGQYFFLNSMNWLQDKKDDVIIAPKTYDSPMLQMTASTANILAICTVIILPLIILGLGTFVWMRRRHL